MDVKFGTSGVRSLAADLLAGAGRAYCSAFLAHQKASGSAGGAGVCIGRDLRSSSQDLANAAIAAAQAHGLTVYDCGVISTPALAFYAMARGAPAIMVTGSHIPADRNGLKFYTPRGEITKADEAAIEAALSRPQPQDSGRNNVVDASDAAAAAYRDRYAGLLSDHALTGLRIGVFQHSTVLRDDLVDLLEKAGAEMVPLGRSEIFVPVDTEAFADPVLAPLAGWVAARSLDALVSADGDGDRPLLVDEQGAFVRGDAMGALVAQALGAKILAVPVTANSALETILPDTRIVRTRVGSPYVVAAMDQALEEGETGVMGFEANGGVLLGSDFPDERLTALPTRDAMLPLLLTLSLARRRGVAISRLVSDLGMAIALADRVAEIPAAAGAAFIARIGQRQRAEQAVAPIASLLAIDLTDGARLTLNEGRTLHFRASGNAPEMRCYVEAPTPEAARHTLEFGMDLIRRENASGK